VFIKPSQKRIEFERLLKERGYKDQSPIIPKMKKMMKQTNYMCSDGAMAIYLFFIPYLNKKSYLWLEFLDHQNSPNLKERIKTLANRIQYHERTRLAEIGWEAKYTKQPYEFSLEERKKIFFSFLKEADYALQCGFDSLDIKPRPGDVLVGKPQGVKINQGFTEASIELGTRQRALVGKKFGLSGMYEVGFLYGKYDKDLKVIPL
jgi:hypothetical protein